MTDEPQAERQPSLIEVAAFGLCPRCGAKTLFARGIRFSDHCRVCTLDFSGFNVGDGPVAFLTLILGGLMTGLALWLEIAVEPPFWIHALIWIPVTVVAVWFGLRAGKGALLSAEFRRGAGTASVGRQDDKP
ncbi:MAG TPA: DUF983 domain-containing protein [Croceibacterium sp.]|nr:DUF983 domain-containing protein [Croceibacterium sp.]